jgi:hypothetical protein
MITVIPGSRPDPENDPERNATSRRSTGARSATLSPAPGEEATQAVEPQVENVPRADQPLSRNQKTKLSILAREAYQKHLETGLIDEDVDFDDWRHEEVREATNGRCQGFRSATQRHFRQIRGHFAMLNGDVSGAFRDAVRDEPAQADWETNWKLLERNCEEKGFAFPEYPAAICRNQFKCAIRDASAKQLFALLCTVRNRTPKL